MRIIHVVGDYSPERCGVAHYTARLGQELVHEGLAVAIASRPTIVDSTLPLLSVSAFPGSLAGLTNLLATARRWSADWLHVQYAPGSYDRRRTIALLPLLARLVPGRPRIATTLHEYGGWPLRPPRALAAAVARGFHLTERAGWLDREALALIGMSDLAIVTNPDHHAAIQARSTALAKRLSVIPIGPNVSLAEPTCPDREVSRRGFGVGHDEVIAVFFGFVHPVKGIETLLQALRHARDAMPRLRLWVVGGVHSLALRGAEADGYEAKIRHLIAELSLDHVVELTGYLSDAEMSRRLRAADVAVLPFNHGATLKSGTLITCLSYGLPLVTTTGGELGGLAHGESVWLVPPRDPAALAAALVSLAGDPLLRVRLGAAGARAVASFSWPTIARRHAKLYHAGLTDARTSGTCPDRSLR